MQEQNIEILKQLHSNNQCEPFIRKIVFPAFKNIAPGQELIFDFPLTILVGKNGTNKSSALLALYGAPEQKNIGEYWFSTALDDLKDERPRYFYTYYDEESGNTAEVLQTKISKAANPDYWETSRPLIGDKMSKIDNSIKSKNLKGTRWGKVNKNTLYLNFRSQISSFDKYFYHSKNTGSNAIKKDFIRKRSSRLKVSVHTHRMSDRWYGSERIINRANSILNKQKVDKISYILGKQYDEINYLEHRYFNVDGGTAILKMGKLNYSEAFAGSGEYAVVSLVSKLMDCEEKSLILLDEPEVSLHPGAQKKLIEFLIEQIKIKKHQIVISTHAPTFLKNLPDEAIKLFIENQITKKIEILNNVHPSAAFNEIGEENEKILVYTEDVLAEYIVQKVIDNNDNLKSRFVAKKLIGGASIIKNQVIPLLSATHNESIVFLDGDQKTELFKESGCKLPKSKDISDDNLEQNINDFFGNAKVYPSGNSAGINKNEKNTLQRKLWDYIEKKVFYLPFNTPEQFLVDSNPDEFAVSSNPNYKELIVSYAESVIDGCITSSEILSIQRMLLKKIPSDNSQLFYIESVLLSYEQ